MLARNAASVLPDPVAAAISVSRPCTISGQPPDCADVGASYVRSNQALTTGWNEGGSIAASPGRYRRQARLSIELGAPKRLRGGSGHASKWLRLTSLTARLSPPAQH